MLTYNELVSGLYTIHELASMMACGEGVIIDTGSGIHCGWIVGIREESGGGKCWLVTVRNKYGKVEGFIRTV